ncbi:hypothetical protein [Lacrimispora sp.]|uniref:hypothetical protein n=1 Tax=Lacrimispora sp. TaxID=2719234 RepID=UPI0028A2D712|nr:hypothetical protein [Lacrimispora sp.]
MTRDQAKKYLIDLGIEQPTDEQVTKYLNSFGGEVQKAEKKAEANKDELERLKAIEEELELEKEKNLSAEEKAKKAEEAVQKALNSAQLKETEFAKKISRLSVENILKEAGLTEADWSGFIDGFVHEDEEVSKNMATNFINIHTGKLNSQKEELQANFEKQILEHTPNPNGAGGGGEGQKSKAEEMAVSLAKKGSATNNNSVISHYLGGN